MSANRQTLEAMLRSFAGVGDEKDPFNYMADDITIEWPASLPYGGVFRGRSAIEAAVGRLRSFWTLWEVQQTGFFEDEAGGDILVAMDVTAEGPGGRAAQQLLERYSFDKSGRVNQIRVFYWDPLDIARAAAKSADASQV